MQIMCGYIKQFRDVESSHAWKITSSQWVFLTFNWAYTTFIPDSIDAYRCLNPANPASHKRIVELEINSEIPSHCIIRFHDILVRSFETFGKVRIDILGNLWEKWNVVEHLRPSHEFSKLSSVEEVYNLWKSASLDEKSIFGYLW